MTSRSAAQDRPRSRRQPHRTHTATLEGRSLSVANTASLCALPLCCSARHRTLPPGSGLGGTLTATDAVKRPSTLPLPYRTVGNTNHTTKRLFSAFSYMADPSPSSPLAPQHTYVNPFPVTTLPQPAALQPSCSAPASGTRRSSSRTSPRYFAPLTPQPTPGTQAKQSSGSGAVRAGASYELDGWLSEPYVEQAYSTLYRTVRNGRASSAWRANSATGGEFDKRSHSHTRPATPPSKPATHRQPTRRVQHVDAWNVADGQVGTGGRHCGDRQRMAGGVDGWLASPYEASERVMMGMGGDGMRAGYRSGGCGGGGGHSHPNVKVAGSGLRDEKRYHSRKSGDGRCYHHCTGAEVQFSSVPDD